mmetsp:Transcript_1885/g.4968  ORF Transcript_1885/g.4968 Transcript_1885/m.4968 type:complete len:286 (+) Transcript_1885:654-1511(+)
MLLRRRVTWPSLCSKGASFCLRVCLSIMVSPMEGITSTFLPLAGSLSPKISLLSSSSASLDSSSMTRESWHSYDRRRSIPPSPRLILPLLPLLLRRCCTLPRHCILPAFPSPMEGIACTFLLLAAPLSSRMWLSSSSSAGLDSSSTTRESRHSYDKWRCIPPSPMLMLPLLPLLLRRCCTLPWRCAPPILSAADGLALKRRSSLLTPFVDFVFWLSLSNGLLFPLLRGPASLPRRCARPIPRIGSRPDMAAASVLTLTRLRARLWGLPPLTAPLCGSTSSHVPTW